MPTLTDLQAARPKCTRIAHVGMTGTKRCDLPMLYVAAANSWKCPKDGTTIKGATLAGWHGGADGALREAA